MSVTRQDVITRLPEYSDIPDGTYFDSVIASAKRQISPKQWGNLVDDGIILLVGHYLEIGKRKGLSGTVSMEKVGDLQRSYTSGNINANSLNATSHGSEYLRLLKTIPSRPVMC